jgi:polyferredoxin
MSIKNFIKEILRDAYGQMTHEAQKWPERLIHKMNVELWKIERRFMKSLASLLILFLAIISFALTAIFFMREYLQLTFTLAFLIIGIILLIIGIILKL